MARQYLKYFRNRRNGDITAVTNVALDWPGFGHLKNATLFEEISADKIPAQFRPGGKEERLNGEMIADWEMR